MFSRDFDKKFDEQFEEARKDFEKAKKFAVGWFIFVACLALALLGGVAFVVYRLLLHYGIM